MEALHDLLEGLIRYVDDRHGSRAAWIVAVCGVVLLLGVPVVILFWLIG